MLLPFIGVIVFIGIYPQADARADRAVGRPVDRPRRGSAPASSRRSPTSSRPSRSPSDDAATRTEGDDDARPGVRGAARSSGGTSARSSPSCRARLLLLVRRRADADVAARRLRRGSPRSPRSSPAGWRCSSGTTIADDGPATLLSGALAFDTLRAVRDDHDLRGDAAGRARHRRRPVPSRATTVPRCTP